MLYSYAWEPRSTFTLNIDDEILEKAFQCVAPRSANSRFYLGFVARDIYVQWLVGRCSVERQPSKSREEAWIGAARSDLELDSFGTAGTVANVSGLVVVRINTRIDVTTGKMDTEKAIFFVSLARRLRVARARQIEFSASFGHHFSRF